jgi:hypothetical protein
LHLPEETADRIDQAGYAGGGLMRWQSLAFARELLARTFIP